MESVKAKSSGIRKRAFHFEHDEWDARALGLRVPEHMRSATLSFQAIGQPWLKQAAKKFVRYGALTKGYSSLAVYLVTLRHFSGFLDSQGMTSSKSLSRGLLVEYLYYLNGGGGSATTRHQRLVLLRTFFEAASVHGWLRTPPYLIREEDIPQLSKPQPRFIPDDVLRQLNGHLDSLPLPIERMVLVIQECGLRIGELVELPLQCIEEDQRGGWHLRHFDFKLKKERIKPISGEIATIIQEQQAYIRSHLPADFGYLFCGKTRGRTGRSDKGRPQFQPVARVMYPRGFQRYLETLAQKHNICDSSGRLWHFESHQFRHTVGARMINSGVPPHIIQRYLGHESPEMTMRYAHIYDETLKREFARYLNGQLVDINGRAARLKPGKDIDREWLKQNILAQALPNGLCSRPLMRGACPHANSCLTCGDFRTSAEFLPQHRKQIETTEEIIEEAKDRGWVRQVEMNTQVRGNLLKIVEALEVENGR